MCSYSNLQLAHFIHLVGDLSECHHNIRTRLVAGQTDRNSFQQLCIVLYRLFYYTTFITGELQNQRLAEEKLPFK